MTRPLLPTQIDKNVIARVILRLERWYLVWAMFTRYIIHSYHLVEVPLMHIKTFLTSQILCKSPKWHWKLNRRFSGNSCCQAAPISLFIGVAVVVVATVQRRKTLSCGNKQTSLYRNLATLCSELLPLHSLYTEQVGQCWADGITSSCACHAQYNLSRDRTKRIRDWERKGGRRRKIADYVVKMSQDIKEQWELPLSPSLSLYGDCLYADAHCNNCLAFERRKGRGV